MQESITKFLAIVAPLPKNSPRVYQNTKYYFSSINLIPFPLTLREVFELLSNRVIILHICATLKI